MNILKSGLFALTTFWSLNAYAGTPTTLLLENQSISSPGVSFVFSDTTGTYLYLKPGQIKAGDTLALQYASPTGETRCCHTLRSTAVDTQGTEQEQVTDVGTDKPVLRYRVNKIEPSTVPFLGIALINPNNIRQLPAPPNSGLPASKLEISTASGLIRVNTCLSMEGLHLFARQQEKLITHLYYALGYDVEASCPEEWFRTPNVTH